MADVGDIYPGTGERVVAKLPNPNGPGYWLQGEYGGVFAEGGAPFLGSYFSIDPVHRNDPNRRFTGIVAEGGGYRSITANPAEGGYGFFPQAPANAPGPAATTPAAPTPQQQREQFALTPCGISAKGTLAAPLAQYGLPASLADRLWTDEYITKGTPIQTITDLVLPQTDEYKQRFPGLTALRERQNRGEAVLVPSVQQYLELEAGIGSVLKDAGLPSGFYDDPSDFATWIGGSVSPKEVEDRIGKAKQIVYSLPVEAREELGRVYGMDMGQAVAAVLDPNRSLPEMTRLVEGAKIGGATRRSGFGLLTQQEMEQLAGSGITDAVAGQRSSQLVGQEGLFAETVGETMTGDELGRADQIGYIGGDAQSAQTIEGRRARRQALFQGGGGAAGGQGRTGLG